MTKEAAAGVLPEKYNAYREKALIRIGEAAVTGMLFEVGAALKPGLVTPISSGSHNDMDYFCFLKSSAVLSTGMQQFVRLGYEYGEVCLPKLRQFGKDLEQRMFEATAGVNTQKGLLFLGGVVCAAAGFCLRNHQSLQPMNIAKGCSSITHGLVERELVKVKRTASPTAGEISYLEHGITGIRGEIEQGLPSILKYGLPAYQLGLREGLPTNEALTQSLLSIMTTADDTVVIHRAGLSGLAYVKAQAQQALALGGMKSEEGIAFVNEMNETFIRQRISPGGSADLLAITVMLYELEFSEL